MQISFRRFVRLIDHAVHKSWSTPNLTPRLLLLPLLLSLRWLRLVRSTLPRLRHISDAHPFHNLATSIPGATTSASPSNNASIRTAGALPGAAALFSVLAAGMGALLGGMLVL